MEKSDTKVKHAQQWITNNRIFAPIVFIGLIVIAIGAFTNAIEDILSFVEKHLKKDVELEVIITNQEETRFSHVYSVQRKQHNGAELPSVYELASWYRVRIKNAKNVATQITDISFNNGVDGYTHPVPQPFFKIVAYPGGKIALNSPIMLPLELGSNGFLEFYILLPMVIPKSPAPIILNALRLSNNEIV